MTLASRIEWHTTMNSGLRGKTLSISATIGNGKRDGEKQVGAACRPIRWWQVADPERAKKRIGALLMKLQRDVLARHQFYNNTGDL